MNLKYKDYFEALPPKISMDKFEDWFYHPKTPVKVNEHGFAESTDPSIVLYEPLNPDAFAIRKASGEHKGKFRKLQFLFCCFHYLKRAPAVILFLDGNPYNCTKSNLIGVNYAPPELVLPALKNTHEFISNTVKNIPIQIQKYADFWSIDDVVHNLRIPKFYLEFYFFPEKMENYFRKNEEAVEISLRRKIYRKNQLNYGI
jgi:hypothetical protein